MKETYVTSDQHWAHANIIRFCKRPFSDSFEMDAYMKRVWNETIKQDDVVYFLGDFTLSRDERYITELLRVLHGELHWIVGNHDNMELIWSAAERAGRQIITHGRFYAFEGMLFSHHPACENMPHNLNGDSTPFKIQRMKDAILRSNKKVKDMANLHGCENIVHGHVHNSIDDHYPGHFNVSADVHGFKPVSLETIKRHFLEKKIDTPS